NVAPMEKIQIEFAAHAEKDWFFHCHNLYHMMSGMAQVISYKDTSQFNKEIHDKIAHDPWYHKLDLAFLSQMSFGSLNISNEHHGFEIEYDTNYDDAYDVDLLYLRNLSRFFDLYVGGNFEKEVHEKHQNTAI